MWWLVACGGPAAPEPVVRSPRAVRVRVGSSDVRLEAAARTLRSAAGEVRLLAVVHVGEVAYYDAAAAWLRPCATVLHEGLDPDPAAPPPDDTDVAVSLASVGLAFQRDALARDDRWVRADRSVVEVRAALAAAGGESEAEAWLVDRDREALRSVLDAAGAGERLRSLVRLSFVRGLAGEPVADDRYWAVVVGGRDTVVVEALERRSPADHPVCIVYGADHAPDLEARLLRRGYARTDEAWLPVVVVPLASVGLGPVQARQFLAR